MRRTKTLFTGIVVAFFLASITCTKNPAGTGPENNTDTQSVASDKNALEITYAAGDNSNSVTKKVGLPASGSNGSSVSWVTSNSNCISIDGTVNRPIGSGDESVTLTATISKGTASDVKVFKITVKGNIYNYYGTVTDIDGNVYQTVKIGNQVWSAENLRTTKYNNGSAIPLVTKETVWDSLTTPGYCYYNNTANRDSIVKFGALYNWYAVDTKKLAPAGWHVPSAEEWFALRNYLVANGYNWDGSNNVNPDRLAKALAAKTDWAETKDPGTIGNNLAINNRSGFSALPSGYRNKNFGSFWGIGHNCDWWSATDAFGGGCCSYSCGLDYHDSFMGLNGCLTTEKEAGLSVRLVKD